MVPPNGKVPPIIWRKLQPLGNMENFTIRYPQTFSGGGSCHDTHTLINRKYINMSREPAQFFFLNQAGQVLFGKYVACRTRRQPNFIENTWAVVNHEMSCAIYEFLCLRPQTVFYKTLFIMKSLAENRPMFQSLLKTSLRFKLLSSLNVLRFVFIYV